MFNRESKLRKIERRLKQFVNTKLLVRPKHREPVQHEFTVSRPVMFFNLLQEVKKDFNEKRVVGTRRDRRRRMIALARKTMRMMREGV